MTVDLEGETCFNIWEVEGNKPLEEAQQLQENKRKRQKTQNHDTTTGERHSSDKSLPQEHVQPSNHAVPATEDLHFYFYVDKSGIVLTVGSLYSFDFCKDSVFICNGISKNMETFKFKFFLCFLGEGKVEGTDRSVCCTLNDMKHVLSRSDVVVGSKAKGLVDKIICEGWDRVLFCQVNNSENVSYLLDLRKSCLVSQIRQGVYSGISRNATRLTAKLKQVRLKFQSALDSRRKSGHSRVVLLYFELCEQIWGGSPATTTLPTRIETNEIHDELELTMLTSPSPASRFDTPSSRCGTPTSRASTPSTSTIELDEDEGPENVAQSNQQNTESSNNAPLLMERRDLLDARLKGHKQEKLKRKLSIDSQFLSVAQEDVEIKKRLIEKLDNMDKQQAQIWNS